MLPKQLMFTVGLVDQITKPIAKISKQFNGLASNYQSGTMKMASGVGGIVGSAYALSNAMQPAIEIDRALGEVKSLGVRDEALKQLTDTSYEYALKYGKSATEFIGSAYDIQSAIEGLSDADLSAFTLSSNVLAAATKADAATITNYMGTMYGIFKDQAISQGKGNWVEQVTGMTATAVKMFKTNGMQMSGAFTAIGAEATSAGIGMNEQMAILGTLQATMSGSEAGTKYKAFLAGVGKAQKSLGLEFTDAQGKMLPMVKILNEIKGKYGDTLDVAEGDELAKAFGSKEAVATVKLLMNDVNGLSGSIKELGKVKGMQQAEKMAAAMTDQSQRLSQSWFVIRAAFGTAILPVFNSFAGWLADLGTSLVEFTENFPALTKYIGLATASFIGLVAVGGLMTVMVGASGMAMTTWKAAADAASWAGGKYSNVLTLMKSKLSGLSVVTMRYYSKLWIKNKALAASTMASKLYGITIDKAKYSLARFNTYVLFSGGYFKAFGFALRGATVSTWGFITSLAAAVWPITLIIAAVGLLAVAIYKYWDPIKAFLGGFWDGLTDGFAPVTVLFSSLFSSLSFVGDMFSWVGEKIGFGSQELAGFAEAGKTFGSIVGGIFNFILWPLKQIIKAITGAINIVKDGVSAITEFFGFGDKSIEATMKTSHELNQKNVPLMAPENYAQIAPVMPSVAKANAANTVPSVAAIAPVKNKAQAGGITQQISNANQQKSTSIGAVNVYPTKGDNSFIEKMSMYS